MTEQEAKEILSLTPEEKVELPNLSEVYEIAIQALEDIQKYRTIGTVEECRTAREKQDEGGNDDDKDSDKSDNQVRTYCHPLADTGTYIL